MCVCVCVVCVVCVCVCHHVGLITQMVAQIDQQGPGDILYGYKVPKPEKKTQKMILMGVVHIDFFLMVSQKRAFGGFVCF